MADFCLALLGPPTLARAETGRLVPQPSAKALALLTYLALESGLHSREELAGLLWGESSDEEARASLRQVLKHLRGQVSELLSITRASIGLEGPFDCEAIWRCNLARCLPNILLCKVAFGPSQLAQMGKNFG